MAKQLNNTNLTDDEKLWCKYDMILAITFCV